MHTFGSSGLVTGYIKQLLATFNLPTVNIYTREFESYFEKYGKESPQLMETKKWNVTEHSTFSAMADFGTAFVPYIKEGSFQVYGGGYINDLGVVIPNQWRPIRMGQTSESTNYSFTTYDRGSYVQNYTKKLQIRNNIYDSYTHEYLGNYLRFLRDYDNIDLMPLYNCFSNRALNTKTECYIEFEKNGMPVIFDASDNKTIIYGIPVKLFKKYTIAIDSDSVVELCCGILSKNLRASDEATVDAFNQISSLTYAKKARSRFNQPFIYDALFNLMPKSLKDFATDEERKEYYRLRALVAEISKRASEFYLFLKVPTNLASTIVILEGDYAAWNDSTACPSNKANEQFFQNHTIISDDLLAHGYQPSLITPLSLLRFNTGRQVPFADRLIEYLLDGCITGGPDTIRENVLMAQFILNLYKTGSVDENVLYDNVTGVWSQDLQKQFYNYASKYSGINFIDSLGYVDKDIERDLVAKQNNKDGTASLRNMINFNLWEDIPK